MGLEAGRLSYLLLALHCDDEAGGAGVPGGGGGGGVPGVPGGGGGGGGVPAARPVPSQLVSAPEASSPAPFVDPTAQSTHAFPTTFWSAAQSIASQHSTGVEPVVVPGLSLLPKGHVIVCAAHVLAAAGGGGGGGGGGDGESVHPECGVSVAVQTAGVHPAYGRLRVDVQVAGVHPGGVLTSVQVGAVQVRYSVISEAVVGADGQVPTFETVPVTPPFVQVTTAGFMSVVPSKTTGSVPLGQIKVNVVPSPATTESAVTCPTPSHPVRLPPAEGVTVKPSLLIIQTARRAPTINIILRVDSFFC
jgi:hypothetical protein